MKARIVNAIVIVSMLCCLLPFQAASSTVVPARFRRITSVAALTANSCYVLADEVGTAPTERVYFMSCNFRNGDAGTRKLKGFRHDAGWEDAFECTRDEVVWQCFINSDGSISLRSVATGLYLSVISPNKLGLQLAASADAELASWQATDAGDGRIFFRPNGTTNRALGADEISGVPYAVFDSYASTKGLAVYKKEETLDDVHGTAVCPADGQDITITCGETALADHAKSTDISLYALNNGKLTADAPCLHFECQWEKNVTGEPQRFRLYDKDKGLFLTATANLGSEPTSWQVVDGKLMTLAEDGSPLYLITDRNTWTTARSIDVASATYSIPSLSIVETLPSRKLSADGTLTLSGGWSSLRLQALSLNGAKCLDLSDVPLPQKLLPFDNSADTPNFPIFVASEAKDLIPDEWQFVALANGQSASLLRSTRLTDKETFFTDRPLSVEAGQLIYERAGLSADHWQTLCLPFPVNVIPENVQAIALQNIGNEQAVFAPVGQLEAGKAYLVRKIDASDTAEPVRFTSANGTVTAKPFASSSLRGTYESFTVAAQTGHVLMLKQTPSAFFPAKAGSHVAPFRAYIRQGEGNGIRSIRIIPYNRE